MPILNSKADSERMLRAVDRRGTWCGNCKQGHHEKCTGWRRPGHGVKLRCECNQSGKHVANNACNDK